MSTDSPVIKIGSATIPISSILNNIIASIKPINLQRTEHLVVLKQFGAENTVSLFGPVRYQLIFRPEVFAANFYAAFGRVFSIIYVAPLMIGLDIDIIMDIPPDTGVPNITELEHAAFRFATCLIFGQKYGLKLVGCACYPQNDSEFYAISAGIGLNCVKFDCKNELQANPNSYDVLVHADCSDISYNSVFLSIGKLITDTETLSKITIIQS